MSSLPLWLSALYALLCACDWLTFPCPDSGADGRPSMSRPPAASHAARYPAGAIRKKHEKNWARRG